MARADVRDPTPVARAWHARSGGALLAWSAQAGGFFARCRWGVLAARLQNAANRERRGGERRAARAPHGHSAERGQALTSVLAEPSPGRSAIIGPHRVGICAPASTRSTSCSAPRTRRWLNLGGLSTAISGPPVLTTSAGVPVRGAPCGRRAPCRRARGRCASVEPRSARPPAARRGRARREGRGGARGRPPRARRRARARARSARSRSRASSGRPADDPARRWLRPLFASGLSSASSTRLVISTRRIRYRQWTLACTQSSSARTSSGDRAARRGGCRARFPAARGTAPAAGSRPRSPRPAAHHAAVSPGTAPTAPARSAPAAVAPCRRTWHPSRGGLGTRPLPPAATDATNLPT